MVIHRLFILLLFLFAISADSSNNNNNDNNDNNNSNSNNERGGGRIHLDVLHRAIPAEDLTIKNNVVVVVVVVAVVDVVGVVAVDVVIAVPPSCFCVCLSLCAAHDWLVCVLCLLLVTCLRDVSVACHVFVDSDCDYVPENNLAIA
jgi:hypothetical protein